MDVVVERVHRRCRAGRRVCCERNRVRYDSACLCQPSSVSGNWSAWTNTTVPTHATELPLAPEGVSKLTTTSIAGPDGGRGVWNRKSLAASGLRSRTQTSSDLLVASSSSYSVWQHLRRDVWGLILNKRSNLPCQTTGERAGMVSSVGMHVWREREKRERRSRNMNVFRFDRIRTGIGNTTKPWRPKIT
jgi:hypothetical protein